MFRGGSRFPLNQRLPRILDRIPFAVAAYSLRKLRNNYYGFAITVRRSSDNATMDIGFDTNGGLDLGALRAFVGSNSAYISKWYDQSGKGFDAIQSTTGNQPRIVDAGTIEVLNSRPAINFLSASNTRLALSGSGLALANGISGFTLSTVWKPATSGSNGNCLYISTTASGTARLFFQKTSTDRQALGGRKLDADSNASTNSTATITSVANIGSAIFNYPANTITGYINGAQDGQSTSFQTGSGNTTSATNSAAIVIGADASGSNALNGPISELILYASAIPVTALQSIASNQKAYYGTP